MPSRIRLLGVVIALLFVLPRVGHSADVTIRVTSPTPPPTWAVLERELLRANAAACREFYSKYFDERGFLLCVERWGGDDGPDDAIENLLDWPILHALGGADDILSYDRRDYFVGLNLRFNDEDLKSILPFAPKP